jgi:hypothetical protein
MHMMLKNLMRWRDERLRITSAEHEIERVRELYAPRIAAAKHPPWDTYHQLVSEMFFELELSQSEIDQVQTNRRLREARHLDVPLPPKPKEGEENEDWRYSQVVGHVLTEEGHRRLRHEIADERELVRKPRLAWAAIVISSVSLLISLLNAVLS